MAQAIVGTANYPTLLVVMNGVRALIDDSMAGATDTPGEGQIVTDSPTISPFTLPNLNASIRELYRRLRNAGDPELIKDNYILQGLPVVNGPQGSGVQDATIQCQLSTSGFYNGAGVNPNFTAPVDMLMPFRIWERQTNSNDTFHDMTQPQEGLESCLQQMYNRQWEYRNGAIWFPGTTSSVDIRIRYLALFPVFFGKQIDYSTTQIPVLDCEDFLIYQTAYKNAIMLGATADRVQLLKAEADQAMFDLKAAWVRRAQTKNFRREDFGSANGAR